MNNLLANIDWKTFGIIVLLVAVIAIIFAILIAVVSKFCTVKVNEKEEKVKEKLAGANCGGCGYAGCADFAKALANGKASINQCGPTPNESKAEIAKILDIPFASSEPTFAIVHCAGGNDCIDKFNYIGEKTCYSENLLMGGRKACPNGCLGNGSCEKVCIYHAMKVKDNVAYADRSLCESCGVCVKTCTKHIIELIPKSARVYVACSSNCRGKDVINSCKKGCIGCGLCAKNCSQGAIEMINNIPKIDYTKCSSCLMCAEKCPRKCIKII